MDDKETEENKPVANKLDVGQETETKLKAILEGGLSDQSEEEKPEEKRVEFERDQTFDDPAESVDPTVFDNPATKSFLDTIDVTEMEKEIFYETLLQDEPFQLTIEVLGHNSVVVGSRNTYEQALCYACLGDLIKEADANGDTSPDIMLWLQRFSCCFAVKSVFGVNQNPLAFEGTSDKVEEEHKKVLRQTAIERFVNMKYPRWQAILNAFMIFTAKEKLLLENVGNQDFWIPAG